MVGEDASCLACRVEAESFVCLEFCGENTVEASCGEWKTATPSLYHGTVCGEFQILFGTQANLCYLIGMRIGRLFSLVLLALLASLTSAQTNWSRWKVMSKTPAEAQLLLDSDVNIMECNIRLGENDVIIGPGEMFKLVALGLDYRFINAMPPANAYSGAHGMDAFNYRTSYGTLAEIQAFWDAMASRHPQFITKTLIGSTIQGRAIYAYRFRPPMPPGSNSKKTIVLDGGIHAREWISPAVMMHIGTKLLDRLIQSPQWAKRLAHCAVSIVPVLNQDGYEHSWTTDRYWRKNRRNNGDGTFGVDLNRNFSVGFGGSGSSGTTSSQTYRGTAAFSEPETTAIKNYALAQPGLLGFIDFHSYSQLLIYPWGNVATPAPDSEKLNTLASAMRNVMVARGGLAYTVGQSGAILYIASGCSDDYMYGTTGAMSMTIELRDTGAFGFVLPASEITPTQNEAWDAFETFFLQLNPTQ